MSGLSRTIVLVLVPYLIWTKCSCAWDQANACSIEMPWKQSELQAMKDLQGKRSDPSFSSLGHTVPVTGN